MKFKYIILLILLLFISVKAIATSDFQRDYTTIEGIFTRNFIVLIISNEELKNLPDEKQLVNYIFNYHNKDVDDSYTKYVLYNENSIQVSAYDYAEKKHKPVNLFSFHKEGVCNIDKRNCSIYAYKYKDENPELIRMTYYDGDGNEIVEIPQ